MGSSNCGYLFRIKMNKKNIFENLKTIFYALIIAFLIRSFLFQPFYIPSASMQPNLLIGDRLFVSKYTYGYSKHSFPFSPPIFKKRILSSTPERGDVIVFKTPADNRTDYIKRLIGLPGDTIQFIDGDFFLNDYLIPRKKVEINTKTTCGSELLDTNAYEETLPNGKKYVAVYLKNGTTISTDKYLVPPEHYFFMGDNRDCSKDSRYLSSVGYVNNTNLVGEAKMLFFSTDSKKGYFFEFWKDGLYRFSRFFSKVK